MARKSDPAKKGAIITAATTVFAQKGYFGTRMAEVARTAGIGKGTIYEYFRSKEDLFFAIFEQLMAESGDQMAAVAATISGSAAQRLEILDDALIKAWLPKLDLYGLVLEFWSATTASPIRLRFKEAFQAGYTEFRKMVSALIRAGMNSGEFDDAVHPEKIASALIGTWDALLLQAWLDPGFDPLGAAREHMKVILKGLSRECSREMP